MHGMEVPVRAAIESIPGLSGHADRTGLLRWSQDMPAPKRTFLTHGEIDSANALAQQLHDSRSWDVVVPALGESHKLD